jgi:copper chaperone CopZ
MKQIIVASILFLTSISAQAGEIYVTVMGLNCALCEKSVEKNFKTLAAVDKLNLDLANNFMHIIVKDKQDIPDAKIKSLLLDAGLNVQKIERSYETKSN